MKKNTYKTTKFSALRHISMVFLFFSFLLLQTEMLAHNWSPVELSTELWLDAAYSSTIETSVDNTVVGWIDKSNAVHGSLSSTGGPPLVENAQPGLDMNCFDLFVTSEPWVARDNATISTYNAVSNINTAAKIDDASWITLADIASVEGFAHPIVQKDLALYQDIIANASGFSNASEIISAFEQKIFISAGMASGGNLPLTFRVLYATSDFDETDIYVSRGTLSGFSSVSSSVYTATITASPHSEVIVDIPADVFTDDLTGDNNVASKQFVWIYGNVFASWQITADVLISASSFLNIYGDVGIDGNLTVADEGKLTMNGSGTITGDVSISAGGSLIATDGSITGTVTYVRNIPTSNWYLIASPVSQFDIDEFVATADLATGTTNSNNIGFSSYDNHTGLWSYYQSGTSASGNFTPGQGYAIKLNAPGSVSFTGSFQNSDIQISLSLGASDDYNLIGNPYLSAVSAGELLGANSAVLSQQTLWLWDQVAEVYTTKNLVEDIEIAPGQGFFVKKSQSGAGYFSIAESMQSHSSIDTFIRSRERSEIALTLSDGKIVKAANIYYIEGTSTGWDNGYDSSIFGGVPNTFAIYTHAVENGTGRDLGIQSLPDNNFENMVVPVGVNAKAGTAITIAALVKNLPEDLKVYLEDKDTKHFTLLNAESEFSTTLENELSGIGRFYLHTLAATLEPNTQTDESNISIYNATNENLHIIGTQNQLVHIKVYNIIGKEVFTSSFEGNERKNIPLPKLVKGMYVVKLSTSEGVTTKKIIIR